MHTVQDVFVNWTPFRSLPESFYSSFRARSRPSSLYRRRKKRQFHVAWEPQLVGKTSAFVFDLFLKEGVKGDGCALTREGPLGFR